MQTRQLGRLWPVSAMTLGGGGLGQVWGATTRDESVATVHEAVGAGITLLDVAPTYGEGEAESVIGEAFDGRLPNGVRVLTKCGLGNPPAGEVLTRLERSLDESLERMRLSTVDIFLLHGYLVPSGAEKADTTSRSLYVEAVRPAFDELVRRGRIGAWGITGIMVPSAILESLAEDPTPGVAQIVTNPLDSVGEMREGDEPARPRALIDAASRHGVGVMGIRAVQAGALTDALDRELPADHPTMLDFRRAEPFRTIAREVGESAASLAHRYALTMPGVDTVVLGVKNRSELRDCLAAEARGPLPVELVARIDAAVRPPSLASRDSR
jgi:aryl-alcohol dehydrogenase-like predicted oxidoreductase